ncbi:hypothetical protein [Kitasatospora sp. HPMI-4]|uniref:hypothetical protein n=1 Tax=Kitasatospora sp. HPMI-4 TaxID=3448443 RepID=UPI003F1B7C70
MSMLLEKVNSDPALAALPIDTAVAQHGAAVSPVLTTPAGLLVIAANVGLAAAGIGLTMALGHFQNK